jgi:hypothetical protein
MNSINYRGVNHNGLYGKISHWSELTAKKSQIKEMCCYMYEIGIFTQILF